MAKVTHNFQTCKYVTTFYYDVNEVSVLRSGSGCSSPSRRVLSLSLA